MEKDKATPTVDPSRHADIQSVNDPLNKLSSINLNAGSLQAHDEVSEKNSPRLNEPTLRQGQAVCARTYNYINYLAIDAILKATPSNN